MVPDEPNLNEVHPLQTRSAKYVDILERFENSTDALESALCEAYDKVWWRTLVKLFHDHYEMAQEDLSMGMENQREEDKTRGFIRAMKIILAFDIQAKSLLERKRVEDENRRRGNGRREERPTEDDF